MSAKKADKTQPAKGKTAAKPTPVAPAAPRFTMGPWPVKSQSGNSIRAYCYKVASDLAKSSGKAGFTLAELASALAGASAKSDMKQPGGGWGTVAKPNGGANHHANWFAHAKQGWLTGVK
jgi:hypothetical protein